MKKYEAMFIVKPDMGKDELKKTEDSIGETITKNKGKVEKCEQWGRRRLAYPIKRYMDGEYYLYEFEIEPGSISSITSSYKLNENILRVLVIAREG
ncbi:MAG: 30S ribosomal protein S6 [Candidatus Omnitrophica bacterium]|nr:30S ribosomal protein S6 [Candidatus Omnitrophota bacterium]